MKSFNMAWLIVHVIPGSKLVLPAEYPRIELLFCVDGHSDAEYIFRAEMTGLSFL